MDKDIYDSRNLLGHLALSYCSNGGVIYKLIDEGMIDHLINKIGEEETIPNVKSLIKKDLTANEQFLMLLDQTISYIELHLPVLCDMWVNLGNMLEGNYPEYLLSKKYWGDNKNIEYFDFGIKSLLVTNFYKNIKKIYKFHRKMFNSAGITSRMSLEDTIDVDKLFNFLVRLIWCNYDRQYNIKSLFVNSDLYAADYQTSQRDILTRNYLNSNYDLLEYNYESRIKTVNKLLKHKEVQK